MPEPDSTRNVYEAMPQARPEAIVVYCCDPRFHAACEAFTEEGLGLRKGRYIPLVVAGGAGVLANPERLPKEFKFMKDRFELLREHFPSMKRLVLINHEDCAYYRMLAERIPGFQTDRTPALKDRPGADLSRVAGIFSRLLSHLDLEPEFYYARFAGGDHDKITFERASS